MNTLKTLAVSAVLALSASAVSAATYLGTYDGNDSLNDGLVIEKLDIDSPGLWKCESGRYSCNLDAYTDYSTADAFKVTLETFKDDDGDAIGGQWGWSGEGVLAPHYMVVKGGQDGYAVWDISDEDGSGYWTTEGLGKAGMSHISFYNTGVSEVPLPASALLLLGGLGGLVAMRRRRK